MRTVAYVDGYNLYYGLLKGTSYKWLDLRAMLGRILHAQNPETCLEKLVFCTANIRKAFASHGIDSVEAQTTYHRALVYTGVIVDSSRHHAEAKYFARFDGTKQPSSERVKAWQLEEKQTDVKLALGMYRDCMSGRYDQVVLVSSDTDLVPAFKWMKKDAPNITLGLVLPRYPDARRPPAGSFQDHTDWTRKHVTEQEVAESLFSKNIHRPGKVHLAKPKHW